MIADLRLSPSHQIGRNYLPKTDSRNEADLNIETQLEHKSASFQCRNPIGTQNIDTHKIEASFGTQTEIC